MNDAEPHRAGEPGSCGSPALARLEHEVGPELARLLLTALSGEHQRSGSSSPYSLTNRKIAQPETTETIRMGIGFTPTDIPPRKM